MKKYELSGFEYACDGAHIPVSIVTGTKKKCLDAMLRLDAGGQYSGMRVDEYFDLAGSTERMIDYILNANKVSSMNPTKGDLRIMLGLSREHFKECYTEAIYSGFIEERGKEVFATALGKEIAS